MRSLQFQRIVGAGGFGSVYLADLVGARNFRRQVAVKVLLANHPDGDMFMSRVRDEARLALEQLEQPEVLDRLQTLVDEGLIS